MAGDSVVRRKVTNARKMGWEDADRLSPQHDAIVHWLEHRASGVIHSWFPRLDQNREYWRDQRIQEVVQRLDSQRQAILDFLNGRIDDMARSYAGSSETRAQRASEKREYARKMANAYSWYRDDADRPLDEIEASLEQEERTEYLRTREMLLWVLERLALWTDYREFDEFGVGDLEKCTWERPIMHSSGNSVVGFVDYAIQATDVPFSQLVGTGGLEKCRRGSPQGATGAASWDIEGLRSRLTAFREGKRPRFDSDVSYLPCWDCRERSVNLCIEVKTEIPQVSELLRQLQFYKVYEKGPWAVASPDWTHAKTLLEQGIGFIPYTPDDAPRVYKPGSIWEAPQ